MAKSSPWILLLPNTTFISACGGSLTYARHHHRETIKLTNCDEKRGGLLNIVDRLPKTIKLLMRHPMLVIICGTPNTTCNEMYFAVWRFSLRQYTNALRYSGIHKNCLKVHFYTYFPLELSLQLCIQKYMQYRYR